MRELHYRGVRWLIEDGLPVSEGFPEYTARRVTDVAHENLTRGRIPRIADLGLRYQRDPKECDLPLPWWTLQRTGVADCKSLSALWLGRKLQTHHDPTMRIQGSGADRLIHVRPDELDPSTVLIRHGLKREGRRPYGEECAAWTPFRGQEFVKGASARPKTGTRIAEAGEAAELHKDEALLHPALREVLRRGRAAGLPVYLVSGHRPVTRQIGLWEARMGGWGKPGSWSDVERNWSRWWSWVDREEHGKGGNGPPLLQPGVSRHQRRPAGAADIGVRVENSGQKNAILGKLASMCRDIAFRPLTSEPWHFEPNRS